MILCDSNTLFVEEAWLQPEADSWVGLQPSLINRNENSSKRRLRKPAAAFRVRMELLEAGSSADDTGIQNQEPAD